MIKESDFYDVIYRGEYLEFTINNYSDVIKYLHMNNYKTFGFITSWNPKGIEVEYNMNIESTENLKKDLARYEYLPVAATSEKYSKEDGFLIFNISREYIIELQNKYQQLAVVYGDENYAEIILKFS
jgi:hypothetical protein